LVNVCGDGEGVRWFEKGVRWKVGVGDKIRLWEDWWVGQCNLREMYPGIYTISLDQGRNVGEVGGWAGSIWHCSLS